MSFQLRRRRIAGLLSCLAAVFLAGCSAGVDEKAEQESAEGKAAEQSQRPKPAAKAGEQQPGEQSPGQQPGEAFGGQQPFDVPGEPAAVPPDPYPVPDGTPAELAEFIERVLQERPRNSDARQKAVDAVMEAAERILAAKPAEADAELAVRVKSTFLGTPEELEAFAGELEEAGLPKLARRVRGTALARRLGEAGRAPGAAAPEALEQLIGQVKQHLAQGPLERGDAALAMTAGRLAEATGNTQLAVETYTHFSKLLAASEEEGIAELGKMMEGIVRRLTLVGKKMSVEGTILGGEQFDWSQYEGKVVLVDFWAAWCPPCVREVPNMKKTYEDYHDLGFEIVGISLDRSRADLEEFIKQQEVPWTILYNDEDPSPTPEHYGVMSIPTMILVGADGNVVSTTARGPQLREELEKLLGPVEQKEEGQKEEEEKPDAPE